MKLVNTDPQDTTEREKWADRLSQRISRVSNIKKGGGHLPALVSTVANIKCLSPINGDDVISQPRNLVPKTRMRSIPKGWKDHVHGINKSQDKYTLKSRSNAVHDQDSERRSLLDESLDISSNTERISDSVAPSECSGSPCREVTSVSTTVSENGQNHRLTARATTTKQSLADSTQVSPSLDKEVKIVSFHQSLDSSGQVKVSVASHLHTTSLAPVSVFRRNTDTNTGGKADSSMSETCQVRRSK